MDDKLKIYELLYQAYADEIKNLWQRSVFLGAFMVLVWTGYGALQLKMIEKGVKELCNYHFLSIGLCAVIIVLSLLWIAMAKGSKFVQEAHEDKINKFDFMNRDINNIFCNLDDYKPKEHKLSSNVFLCGGLDDNFKAYRYSPSKINIALGCFSAVIATILCMIHTIFAMQFYNTMTSNYDVLFVILMVIASLIAICLIPCFIKRYLKGRKQDRQDKQNAKTTTKKQKGESKMTTLFFCQHCGAFFRCNLDDITDEYKLQLFAKEQCELSSTHTHILSSIVLTKNKKVFKWFNFLNYLKINSNKGAKNG